MNFLRSIWKTLRCLWRPWQISGIRLIYNWFIFIDKCIKIWTWASVVSFFLSVKSPNLLATSILFLAVPLRREGQLYKWLRHSLTHSKTPKNYPKTPKIKFLGRFRSTKLLLYFSQQKLTISSLTFHPMTWTPCEDQPIFVKWFWNVPQTGVHCIIQPLGEFWREKKNNLKNVMGHG